MKLRLLSCAIAVGALALVAAGCDASSGKDAGRHLKGDRTCVTLSDSKEHCFDTTVPTGQDDRNPLMCPTDTSCFRMYPMDRVLGVRTTRFSVAVSGGNPPGCIGGFVGFDPWRSERRPVPTLCATNHDWYLTNPPDVLRVSSKEEKGALFFGAAPRTAESVTVSSAGGTQRGSVNPEWRVFGAAGDLRGSVVGFAFGLAGGATMSCTGVSAGDSYSIGGLAATHFEVRDCTTR